MVTLYIPAHDQYFINGHGRCFKYDRQNDVYMDLLKNNIYTLRGIAKRLGYKPSRMKKMQIYELIRHLIVFQDKEWPCETYDEPFV